MAKDGKKGNWISGIVKEKIIGKRVLIVLILVVVLVCVVEACSAAKDAYEEALAEQSQTTYQAFYSNAFDMAEKKYHVSNEVKISIEEVRETAQLEVLQVSDIEYVFHEDNNKIWTAVRGHGVYTVDLTLSEFVIDNARQYVLARVPEPKLNTAGLDYEYENFLFENGIFNGNTSEGVNLAREDLKNAQNQLQVKLTSTQSYYETAEKSARELIEQLVKNFNPEVPGLVVEVEFID